MAFRTPVCREMRGAEEGKRPAAFSLSPHPEPEGEMKFLRGHCATASVEWLIVVIIVIVAVGAVLLGIFDAIRDKLEAIRDSL